jgi:hypothetical protein
LRPAKLSIWDKEQTVELQRDAFHRAVDVLTQLGDPELLDAYKAYVARLEASLGSAWLDTYAAMYQRDRRQLTGQSAGVLVLPEEIAVRDRAGANAEVAELYDRYIALLARKELLDEQYIR